MPYGVKMKRRSRSKPASFGSGKASSEANRQGGKASSAANRQREKASSAANRQGKDEGKRQQRSGGAASSASSGDEISSSRSVSSSRSLSSGEEATGRTRRPRKKERQQLWAENAKPGTSFPAEAQQKKSLTGKSTSKEKSSTSHSTENKAWEEESSSSRPKEKINTGDVEVSSRIVRKPNQDQQVKHSGGSFDQPASNREGDALVATEAYAVPLNEVVGDGSTGDILKEGCLDDAKLSSRSGSVEAQEQASFDEVTSTLLMGEDRKKPKLSSGELSNIARDGDEHSGKKTAYGDLKKMIALDGDEKHPDTIGVPAIEDLKQGKEGAGWRALLDIDIDTVSEKTIYYFMKLRSDHPEDACNYLPPYEPHQLSEVYEQLALYRIRGYQLSVDQQLDELDDENLKKHYSSTDLFNEGYFEYYEESLEWYFDPELCKCPGYDDYQQLVLHNDGEYLDWDTYHSTLNTYEKDLAYVQYCEALANETKWIEDYLAQSTHQWERVKNVAFLQALQIAAGFANVSPRLVLLAFDEYTWSILSDHSTYKDMDGIYFEIWKRVAKLKKDFREALLEIHRENMFPSRALEIESELENKQVRLFYMKDDYDAYVAGIDEMASDDKAYQDITVAVKKMFPKRMIYLDYIQKKVDVAKDIGMIGKAPPHLRGDHSQGEHRGDNSAK